MSHCSNFPDAQMVELRIVLVLRLRFVHEDRWTILALGSLGPTAAVAAEDHLSSERIPRPRRTEGRGHRGLPLSLASVPYLEVEVA